MESGTQEPHPVTPSHIPSPSSSYPLSPTIIPRPASPRTPYKNTDYPGLSPGLLERVWIRDDCLSPEIDPEQVQEEWTKLRSLRTSALRLRSDLQRTRTELREKEAMKRSADEAFMKHVRGEYEGFLQTAVSPSLNIDLEKCFAAMQAARDDYGELEYEYNGLEDLSAEVEYELAKLEKNVYASSLLDTFDVAEPVPPERPDDYLTANGLLGISEHSGDYHPLHAEYLSRLGDLDLAWERYGDLMNEREVLMSRSRPENVPDEDHRVLQQHLLGQATTLRSEIAAIEEDVERLKAQCLEAGIVLEDTSNPNLSGNGMKNSSSGGSLVSTSLSDYAKFPFLLSQPEEQDGAFTAKLEESSTSERINQWILHKFQTSPSEVNLFMRTASQMTEALGFGQLQTDATQWQKDVLSFWMRDRANKPNGHSEFSRTRRSSMSASAIPVHRNKLPTRPRSLSQGDSGHKGSSHSKIGRDPASIM